MNTQPTPRSNAAWSYFTGYTKPFQNVKNLSHELERELAAVTEQRDELANLVKQFIYILDITEESDGGRLFHPTNITSCRANDLQKIGEIVEALRKVSKKL